jgi:hypothetical protein
MNVLIPLSLLNKKIMFYFLKEFHIKVNSLYDESSYNEFSLRQTKTDLINPSFKRPYLQRISVIRKALSNE